MVLSFQEIGHYIDVFTNYIGTGSFFLCFNLIQYKLSNFGRWHLQYAGNGISVIKRESFGVLDVSQQAVIVDAGFSVNVLPVNVIEYVG